MPYTDELITAATNCTSSFKAIQEHYKNNVLPGKPGRAEHATRFKSLIEKAVQAFSQSQVTKENLLEKYSIIFTIYALLSIHKDIINDTCSANTSSMSSARSAMGAVPLPGFAAFKSEGDAYLQLLTGFITDINAKLGTVPHQAARTLDIATLLPDNDLAGPDILANTNYFHPVIGAYGRDIYGASIHHDHAKGYVSEQARTLALVNTAGALLGPGGLAVTGVASYVYCKSTGLDQVASDVYAANDNPAVNPAYLLLKSVLMSDEHTSTVCSAYSPTFAHKQKVT